MKRPPQNPEFDRFRQALSGVLEVSKEELDSRVKAEKSARKGKRKPCPTASRSSASPRSQ
jgi:hypothetical protein